MNGAVGQARTRGEQRLPDVELAALSVRCGDLMAAGLAANPPPERPPRQKGRLKQSPERNLPERLWKEHEAVLAFLDDLTVPFDNNQAEQDLRMPGGPAENRRLLPFRQRLGSLRADQRL